MTKKTVFGVKNLADWGMPPPPFAKMIRQTVRNSTEAKNQNLSQNSVKYH